MKNVQKETPKALEVIDAEKPDTKGSTPTVDVPKKLTPREEVQHTLNYLNATYSLLENGLFVGKDSNVLIQVKAWLENQQKALSLQMAKIIAVEGK